MPKYIQFWSVWESELLRKILKVQLREKGVRKQRIKCMLCGKGWLRVVVLGRSNFWFGSVLDSRSFHENYKLECTRSGLKEKEKCVQRFFKVSRSRYGVASGD